jgi:hypothetical protein
MDQKDAALGLTLRQGQCGRDDPAIGELCLDLLQTCRNYGGPLDFMARLAALIPRPRANLTRFHGIFAPNSKYRALVTPAKRGKGNNREENCKTGECEPPNLHTAMTWAQRLKRVFNIDITTCEECGGTVKVIASIEDLD